jgi:heme exporter protein D
MLLGVPLATYGGWTAIDKLLENQRAKQTEEELDAAKQKYQAALMGTYKKAIDTRLDQLFAHYEKQASVKDLLLNPLNWLANAPSEYFPNATGAAKGVGAAYALATAPLGYHIVNKAMKKRNKESLLREAMQERARRQALTQPPEIYAIPTPTQEDSAE